MRGQQPLSARPDGARLCGACQPVEAVCIDEHRLRASDCPFAKGCGPGRTAEPGAEHDGIEAQFEPLELIRRLNAVNDQLRTLRGEVCRMLAMSCDVNESRPRAQRGFCGKSRCAGHARPARNDQNTAVIALVGKATADRQCPAHVFE